MSKNPYESPETRAASNDHAQRVIRNERPPAGLSVLFAAAGSIGTLMFLTCMCGHIDWWGTAITLPAAACGWYALTTIRRQKMSHAILTILVAAIATLVLLKNVTDGLWYGHDAIWPSRPVPGATGTGT